MRKIIFEQIGNIITFILIIFAMIQSVISSPISSNDHSIILGNGWIIFIVWCAIFGVCRYIFSKKIKNYGYNMKKGEFSCEDEREDIISKKSSKISYISMIFASQVFFVLFFFSSFFILNLTLIKVIAIALLGAIIIIGFISYLLAWVVLDYKY